MGKKDFGKRETKKSKKDTKKLLTTAISPIEPAPEVEVIGKRKKRKEEEE